MTDHDPTAVEVLEAASLTSHMEERWDGAEIVLHTNALAAELALDALTAAGLAVVQVGEVPPWMREVAHRALWSPDDDDSWWYGDHESGISKRQRGYQPLYIIDPEWTP